MGKVLVVACTNVGRAIIETIESSNKMVDVDLVGIVNLKASAAIQKANYDPYTDLIQKYDLNAYYCDDINEKECVQFMRECSPDIIIQSGWSQKFSREVLNIPRYACIGEHPAPLPKGRGAACVNWAIITGERRWGDTFFKMEMQYDTGMIFAQQFFDIKEYDDVKTVYDKVAKAAVITTECHLTDWANGKLAGTYQDDTESTHYPRRRPSDGEFDFAKNSLDIYNEIRGQTKPYPGAYFIIAQNGFRKKVYVWRAELGSTAQGGGIQVRCGDGKEISLIRIQIEGEPEGWAADVINEHRVEFEKVLNLA